MLLYFLLQLSVVVDVVSVVVDAVTAVVDVYENKNSGKLCNHNRTK